MLNYQAAVDGSQVVLRIDSVQGDLVFFTSEDGWFRLTPCSGGCGGLLGYGACELFIDPKYLPLEVKSPTYEHASDLEHTLNNLTKNLEAYNGNVLP